MLTRRNLYSILLVSAFILVGCGGGQERQASSSALSIQTLSNIPVGQGPYDQQVQEMYIAYYGRPADPCGLAYWSTRIAAAGGSLSGIIQEFGNSAEADSLYKSLGTQGAVTALYQQQFGRAPDTGGLNYYVSNINNGTFSLVTVSANIFYGATEGSDDKEMLKNKVEVANVFTEALRVDPVKLAAYSGNTAASLARGNLAEVTSDDASVSTSTTKLTTLYASLIALASGDTDTGSSTGGSSELSTSFDPPASFTTAIVKTFTATLTAATDLSNRSRYMISDAASTSPNANYLKIDSVFSPTAGYGASSTTIGTASTYNTYLSSLFLVVSDASGYFRIDSHLHPNNALDFDANDSNKLKFRNNFGKAETTYGYITFLYNPQSKTLQAKKRYVYSFTSVASSGTTTYTPTWTEDTSFSAANYFVNHTGGTYKLVAAESSATPLYLFESPIDVGIPLFMNLNLVEYVTNSPAPFISKVTTSAVEGVNGSIYKGVNATYRSQVASAGSNDDTRTAAVSMLATIKSAVQGNGGTLRYSTDLYTAFRDAALRTTLVSDSISDGTPGQNLVPYVYFTNEQDDSGAYHPFMIIVSYGNQASPNGLIDVPHPPALGSGSYPDSKVTRFSNLENYIHRIPMRNYGQVIAVTDNAAVITENLWTARRSSSIEANVYTYADAADNGVLVDGSVMFPAYNNNLVPSHLFGELTASGCHVGQGGGGPHCHMDGYQSGAGLGLYNDSDYVGKTHPPLIGFGYDGIALFGKYRGSVDSSLLGYSSSLDGFGGHDHDGIGYHYHAHTVSNHTPSGQSYSTDMNVLMKGAYIGNVTSVPNFRSRDSRFNSDKYLGGSVTP